MARKMHQALGKTMVSLALLVCQAAVAQKGSKAAQEPGPQAQHAPPVGAAPKSQPAGPTPGQKAEETPQTGQGQHAQHGAQKPQESQKGSQRESHMQQMGRIPVVKSEFPRLGKSQERPSAPLIQIDELERMALAGNPTLVQAETEIRTSKARQLQSGLYPNPRAGYLGEEIRGGSYGGGEQGFFVSQTFVTAGKLGLNRKIAGQDVRIPEVEAEEQRLRVLNAVRLACYRVLSAQEMLDTKRDLLRIAEC